MLKNENYLVSEKLEACQFGAVDKLLETIKEELKKTVKNYAGLKQKAVYEEFVREVEALKESIGSSEEDFKAIILQRCADRANTNQSTALNFTAMINGEINALYWKLANLVFEPNNLHELLSVLLPNVKYVIDIDFGLARAEGFSLKHPKMLIRRLPITTLDKPVLPADLSSYIIVKDTLFSIDEIANFDLERHQQFYQLCEKQYPVFHCLLYQHNEPLKAIAHDVSLLLNQSQTPKEALSQLVKGLRLDNEERHSPSFDIFCRKKAISDFRIFWQGLV